MKAVLCLAVFTITAGLVAGAGILSGGFTDRATNDEDVQRAAEFAAKQLADNLVSIESARSQVSLYARGKEGWGGGGVEIGTQL